MADLSNLFNFLSRFSGSNASDKLAELEKAHGNGDGTLLRSEFRDAVIENFDMIEVYGWNGEHSSAKDLADKWFESMDSVKSQSKIEGTYFNQWGALTKNELNNVDKELDKAIAGGWVSEYNGDIDDFETVNNYRKLLEQAKKYITDHKATINKLMPNNEELKAAVETIGSTNYKVQNYTKQQCKELEKLYSVIATAVDNEEKLVSEKKTCKTLIATLQGLNNAELNNIITKHFGENPTAKVDSYTNYSELHKAYVAFYNEANPVYQNIVNPPKVDNNDNNNNGGNNIGEGGNNNNNNNTTTDPVISTKTKDEIKQSVRENLKWDSTDVYLYYYVANDGSVKFVTQDDDAYFKGQFNNTANTEINNKINSLKEKLENEFIISDLTSDQKKTIFNQALIQSLPAGGNGLKYSVDTLLTSVVNNYYNIVLSIRKDPSALKYIELQKNSMLNGLSPAVGAETDINSDIAYVNKDWWLEDVYKNNSCGKNDLFWADENKGIEYTTYESNYHLSENKNNSDVAGLNTAMDNLLKKYQEKYKEILNNSDISKLFKQAQETTISKFNKLGEMDSTVGYGDAYNKDHAGSGIYGLSDYGKGSDSTSMDTLRDGGSKYTFSATSFLLQIVYEMERLMRTEMFETSTCDHIIKPEKEKTVDEVTTEVSSKVSWHTNITLNYYVDKDGKITFRNVGDDKLTNNMFDDTANDTVNNKLRTLKNEIEAALPSTLTDAQKETLFNQVLIQILPAGGNNLQYNSDKLVNDFITQYYNSLKKVINNPASLNFLTKQADSMLNGLSPAVGGEKVNSDLKYNDSQEWLNGVYKNGTNSGTNKQDSFVVSGTEYIKTSAYSNILVIYNNGGDTYQTKIDNLNNSIKNLYDKYYTNYKTILGESKIAELFKTAEENAIAKFNDLGEMYAQGGDHDATIKYCNKYNLDHAGSGIYGISNNGDDWTAMDTMVESDKQNNCEFSVTGFLLQIVYEMERLMRSEML